MAFIINCFYLFMSVNIYIYVAPPPFFLFIKLYPFDSHQIICHLALCRISTLLPDVDPENIKVALSQVSLEPTHWFSLYYKWLIFQPSFTYHLLTCNGIYIYYGIQIPTFRCVRKCFSVRSIVACPLFFLYSHLSLLICLTNLALLL